MEKTPEMENPTENSKANLPEINKREKLKLLSNKRQMSIIENRKSLAKEISSFPNREKEEKTRKEALQLLEKKQAQEAGIDYSRIKNMNYSIQDVDRWNEKQEKKNDLKDDGFTDFIQIAAKSYNRKIRNLAVNQDKYSKVMEEFESKGDSEAVSIHHKPTNDALQVLSNSVQESSKKTKKRDLDDTSDVTFINNRNMHFNKKLARSYDAFTKEIRENLERGTAL